MHMLFICEKSVQFFPKPCICVNSGKNAIEYFFSKRIHPKHFINLSKKFRVRRSTETLMETPLKFQFRSHHKHFFCNSYFPDTAIF